MNENIKIIPALIPKDYNDLETKLEKLKGVSDVVHIDICDGKFAGHATWPLVKTDDNFVQMVAQERGMPFWEDFEFEFHLLVENPFGLIPDLISAGASKIIIHSESVHLEEDKLLLDQLRTEGVVEVGIAFKLDTSLEEVQKFLPFADFVLFMSIENIGFQGMPFDSEVISKIKWLHTEVPTIQIAVDGGVNIDNIGGLYDVGARRFVVGSYILQSVSPMDAMRELDAAI